MFHVMRKSPYGSKRKHGPPNTHWKRRRITNDYHCSNGPNGNVFQMNPSNTSIPSGTENYAPQHTTSLHEDEFSDGGESCKSFHFHFHGLY